jgi:hypothetical protein
MSTKPSTKAPKLPMTAEEFRAHAQALRKLGAVHVAVTYEGFEVSWEPPPVRGEASGHSCGFFMGESE